MTSVIIAVKTILNITAYLPRRPVNSVIAKIDLLPCLYLTRHNINDNGYLQRFNGTHFRAPTVSFLVVSESPDSQITQSLDKSHCLFWKHDHREADTILSLNKSIIDN